MSARVDAPDASSPGNGTDVAGSGCDAAEGRTHPATFSQAILDVLAEQLATVQPDDTGHWSVLDPFAGFGNIHRLAGPDISTYAVEIEPEWAAAAHKLGNETGFDCTTVCADSICWAETWTGDLFGVLATSPVYPNGIADNYVGKGKTRRNTYASHLGHLPSPGSNAGLGRWSRGKRNAHLEFQQRAWRAFMAILRPDGVVLLNVKDPMWSTAGVNKVGPFTASMWQMLTEDHGLILENLTVIPTRGLVDGSNHEQRTGCEYVLRLRKP